MLEHRDSASVRLESINISAGGVFFRSNKPFAENEQILLRFDAPWREEPMLAECEVIHSLETIPGRQYFVGTRFKRLHAVDRETLSDQLDSHFT